jgi:hypothetical protein
VPGARPLDRIAPAAGRVLTGDAGAKVHHHEEAPMNRPAQWQIEALRRLEIPEDMQKKHRFKPLGAADRPVKTMILGENNARLYKYDKRAALAMDRVAVAKAAYEKEGTFRSNLRYGYVVGG